MRQRRALWITAVLTVFVLGAGSLIALSLMHGQRGPAPVEAAVVSPSDPATVDILLAREAEYQARLQKANQEIQQANATIAQLQQEQAALVTQNQTLLAREAAYQQTLQRANALLQQQAARQASPAPAAPAYGQPYSDDGAFESHNREGDDD